MENSSVIKNKEIVPFVTTWTDFEGIMLSEISQTDRNKYWMIYVWSLKKTNRIRFVIATTEEVEDG